MMHQHSLLALLENAPRLSNRERAIVEMLQNDTMQHLGRTDRMIMNALGFTDPNAVRPRITTLIERGVLEECGECKDGVTGQTVRRVRIKLATGTTGDRKTLLTGGTEA